MKNDETIMKVVPFDEDAFFDDKLDKTVEPEVSDKSTQTTQDKAPEQEDRGTLEADDTKEQTDSKESDKNKQRSDVSDPDTDKLKQVKPFKPVKSRRDQRIDELLAENKRLKETQSKPAVLATEELQTTKTDKGNENANKIPELIPPPQKPAYSREQLTALRAQYRPKAYAGDVEASNMLDIVEDEMRKLDKYEVETATWEVRNQKAWETHQSHTQYYLNEAIKKWPDLQKPDSEITKAYETIASKWLPPTLLKQINTDPQGRYLLASVADLRVRASRSDALEQEIKTLKEQLAERDRKLQPQKQTQTQKTGTVNKSAQTDDDVFEDIWEKRVA